MLPAHLMKKCSSSSWDQASRAVAQATSPLPPPLAPRDSSQVSLPPHTSPAECPPGAHWPQEGARSCPSPRATLLCPIHLRGSQAEALWDAPLSPVPRLQPWGLAPLLRGERAPLATLHQSRYRGGLWRPR